MDINMILIIKILIIYT